MMTLFLMGLAVMLGLIIIALGYRSKAQQATHYAAIQATIAEAALNQVQHRAELDTALSTLAQNQRQETIDETDPQNLARRDGLDNSWTADAGLHDAISADSPTDRATATDTPGIAARNRRRSDLSD